MEVSKDKSILVVKRKPPKCPNCGCKVVSIYYGYPNYITSQAVERGEIYLGGIKIEPNSPDWICTQCGTRFIKESVK